MWAPSAQKWLQIKYEDMVPQLTNKISQHHPTHTAFIIEMPELVATVAPGMYVTKLARTTHASPIYTRAGKNLGQWFQALVSHARLQVIFS